MGRGLGLYMDLPLSEAPSNPVFAVSNRGTGLRQGLSSLLALRISPASISLRAKTLLDCLA